MHRHASSAASAPGKKKKRGAPRRGDDRRKKSAAQISRWWRRRVADGSCTPAVVVHGLARGMSMEEAHGISFDDLAARLRQPELLAAMQRLVQRVFYLSYGRKGTRRTAEANLNIRVFLAAYMIWFRRSFVFEHFGRLERPLHAAAKPLLDSFHRICDELQSKGSIHAVARELTDDFPFLLNEYMTHFREWKCVDEEKLGARIQHAICALYDAEASASADGDTELAGEIRAQQGRLRYKLMQVAGPKVLRDFDKEQGRGDLPLPTSADAPPAPAANSGANPTGSLPTRMSNEQLAHELLLDPAFRLGDSPNGIQRHFHRAFWASLVSDLTAQPPCFTRVVRVVGEIRDGIAELASGTPQVAQIDRAVDLDAINAAVAGGVLPWSGCVKLIADVMDVVKRMQARGRDAETARMVTDALAKMHAAEPDSRPKAFCDALEMVLERVNAIRIDAANTRLRMIAPVIKIHGIEYERAHTEKRVKEGQTLERTAEWLAYAVRRADPALHAELREGKAAAFALVHRRAVASLVTTEAPPAADAFPETLLLDLGRIRGWNVGFRAAVFGTSMLMQLLPLAHAAVCAFFKTYAPSSFRPDAALAALCADLRANGASDATLAAVEAAAAKSTTGPIPRLFAQRFETVVTVVTTAPDAGALPSPAQHMIPAVAAPLLARVQDDALALRKVAALNLKVHCPAYNRIIRAAATHSAL